MAINLNPILAQIASGQGGRTIGAGLAGMAQNMAKNKQAEEQAVKQQQIIDLQMMEARKGVMQDYSFEMTKAYQSYPEGSEDLDTALGDITSKYMPQMAKTGMSTKALEAFSTGDYPTAEQASTTAMMNKDYAALLSPAGEKTTNSAKKRAELLKLGYPKALADGLAYDMYRSVTDPSTGDTNIFDIRGTVPRQVPPAEEAAVGSAQDADRFLTTVTEGTKVSEKFKGEVKELADDVARTNITRVEAALSEVEKTVNPLIEQGKDIPGFGATGMTPDFMLTTTGKFLRQKVQKVFNMELKDRSGAAVTTPELDRLKKEFGTGALKTDAQLTEALRIYRVEVNKIKADIAAGHSDDVLKEWNSRSPGTPFVRPSMEKQGKPSDAVVPQSRQQILEDGLKYGWTQQQIQETLDRFKL